MLHSGHDMPGISSSSQASQISLFIFILFAMHFVKNNQFCHIPGTHVRLLTSDTCHIS